MRGIADMKATTKQILTELLTRYPVLEDCGEALCKAAEAIIVCYRGDHKLLICGNGGSAADALHITGELMKSFILPRQMSAEDQKKFMASGADAEYLIEHLQGALPAISLVGETSLVTAYANDVAPDLTFAQQVYGYGRKGDILLALSTSGNSKNVLYACKVARAMGLFVISLTGETGGRLSVLSDVLINVPEMEAYKVQELHVPVYHALCLAAENEFFGE
jgi:D-sedoheptulose 7-phosphate isomerase